MKRDFHFGCPDQDPYTPTPSPNGQISSSHVPGDIRSLGNALTARLCRAPPTQKYSRNSRAASRLLMATSCSTSWSPHLRVPLNSSTTCTSGRGIGAIGRELRTGVPFPGSRWLRVPPADRLQLPDPLGLDTDRPVRWLVVITGVAVVLRLWELGLDLWLDEIVTVEDSRWSTLAQL